MNTFIKTLSTAAVLSLGLSASPVMAQSYGGSSYDSQYGSPSAEGYHEDGTLNVFGAHINPPRGRSNGVLGSLGGGDNGYDPSATGSIGERSMDRRGPARGGYSAF